jgi:hypothetical protein
MQFKIMEYEMKSLDEKKIVYTYCYLYESAKLSFQQGFKYKYGRLYNYLNSITMAAFTLEAYLNHCGEELISYWEDIERISVQKKLNVICNTISLKIDKSKRPFKTIYEIIKIRNLLAHGRTETIIADTVSGPIQTKWESKCNKSDVEKYLHDLEEIIRKIHKKAFNEINPFIVLAVGFAE